MLEQASSCLSRLRRMTSLSSLLVLLASFANPICLSWNKSSKFLKCTKKLFLSRRKDAKASSSSLWIASAADVVLRLIFSLNATSSLSKSCHTRTSSLPAGRVCGKKDRYLYGCKERPNADRSTSVVWAGLWFHSPPGSPPLPNSECNYLTQFFETVGLMYVMLDMLCMVLSLFFGASYCPKLSKVCFCASSFDFSFKVHTRHLKILASRICKIFVVEGLNVINDPKCNKVLNVITFCPKCNKLLSCKLQ